MKEQGGTVVAEDGTVAQPSTETSVAEGTRNNGIRVTRSSGAGGSVSVAVIFENYAGHLDEETAHAVRDRHFIYPSHPTKPEHGVEAILNWADGEDGPKDVPIEILNDDLYTESIANHVLQLTLRDVTGGAIIAHYATTTTVTIQEDDTPIPTGTHFLIPFQKKKKNLEGIFEGIFDNSSSFFRLLWLGWLPGPIVT